MPHVFVSYVKENRRSVERLCADLRRNGIDVWLDREAIQPGTRWRVAIRAAIQSGSFFIACFSPEYLDREKTFMNEELSIAIEELRQYQLTRTWFIPILFADCEVPDIPVRPGETLRDFHHVPLYRDWTTGIERIRSVIRPPDREEIEGRIRELARRTLDLRSQLDSDTDCDAPFAEDDPNYQRLEEAYRALTERFVAQFGVSYDPLSLLGKTSKRAGRNHGASESQ